MLDMSQGNCRPQEYVASGWRRGYALRSVGRPALRSMTSDYERGFSVEIAGWQPTPSEIIENTKTMLALQGIPEQLVDVSPLWLVYASEDANAALAVKALFMGLLSAGEGNLNDLKLFSIGGDEGDSYVGHGFTMVGHSPEELMASVKSLTELANEQLSAIESQLVLPVLPTE